MCVNTPDGKVCTLYNDNMKCEYLAKLMDADKLNNIYIYPLAMCPAVSGRF